MKIGRKSLHHRYTYRPIVEGPALIAVNQHVTEGQCQQCASLLVNAVEKGKPCAYSVLLTMPEVRLLIAQLEEYERMVAGLRKPEAPPCV
jgi:hypothetical protein